MKGVTHRVVSRQVEPMTERELSRAATRRLAIIRHAEEVTSNFALTCRY